MKAYSIIALAAAVALVPSCATMESYGSVRANQVGVAQQVLPATIVSAESVTQETGSTNKNLGTGIGAAVGLAGGQLLGKGSGRIASTVGFAAAGALAGRYLVDSMGKTKCQRLTVRIDGSGETFSFVQPVYKSFGELTPGMHGNYHHGTDAHFTPDGVGAAY